jgi:hypothetical protein
LRPSPAGRRRGFATPKGAPAARLRTPLVWALNLSDLPLILSFSPGEKGLSIPGTGCLSACRSAVSRPLVGHAQDRGGGRSRSSPHPVLLPKGEGTLDSRHGCLPACRSAVSSPLVGHVQDRGRGRSRSSPHPVLLPGGKGALDSRQGSPAGVSIGGVPPTCGTRSGPGQGAFPVFPSSCPSPPGRRDFRLPEGEPAAVSIGGVEPSCGTGSAPGGDDAIDAGGRATHGAVAEGLGEGRRVVWRCPILIFRGWCIAMCVRRRGTAIGPFLGVCDER